MKDSKLKVIENNFDIWWKKTTNRQPSKNFARIKLKKVKILKDLFEKSGFDFTEKEVNKLLTYIKEN